MHFNIVVNFNLRDLEDPPKKEKGKDLYTWTQKHPHTELENFSFELYQKGNFIGSKPENFKPSCLFLDMDGTTIVEESMEVLIEDLGLERSEKDSKLMEEAMEGKIPFTTSLKRRMELLKGITLVDFKKTREKITLSQGILELTSWFREKNLPVFLVSGGLSVFCEDVAQKIGATRWHANHPEIKEGKLTGKIEGLVVDKAEKGKWHRKICQEFSLDPRGSLMIGDGANDKDILEASGIAIGYLPRKNLFPHIQVFNGTRDHSLISVLLES